MKRIPFCFVVVVALVGAFQANAAVVLLEQSGVYDLASFSSYAFSERSRPPSDHVQEKVVSLSFVKIPNGEVDFGYRRQSIWVKTEIRHALDDEATWVLNFNTRFMNSLDVYLMRNGQVEHLLYNSDTSLFQERPLKVPKLALTLGLLPKETVTLYVHYWSRGTTALPLRLEAPEHYASTLTHQSLVHAAFYAIMAAFILFAVLQRVFINGRLQMVYLFYVCSVVLYVLHMDGLSFQYLWPDFPHWNAYASLPLGLLISVSGAQFSRLFLNTRQRLPALDKLLFSIFPAAVLVLLYGSFVDAVSSKQVAMVLNLLALLIGLWAGYCAYAQGLKSARFFMTGWGLLCFASIWTNIAHIASGWLPVASSFDWIRIGITADALMFQLALADQAHEKAKERDQLLEREKRVLLSQQMAERAVYQAEQELLSAMALAKQKAQILQAANHDLKQPLVSMRLALARMKNEAIMDAAAISRFEKSVDYLEFLVSETGRKAPVAEGVLPEHRLPAAFPVKKITESIDAMFREEAEAKGLQFRCQHASWALLGVASDVLRIVSNLVSNAIKYTEQGKVLVGCKRCGDYLAIVVADTGPGMSLEDQATVFQDDERVEQARRGTTGSGLGLPIARQLADKNGYRLVLKSQAGGPSFFAVLVPLALAL